MDPAKLRQIHQDNASEAKDQQRHDELVGSMRDVLMATVLSKDPKLIEVANLLARLMNDIAGASENFASADLNLLPRANVELATSIENLTDQLSQHSANTDLQPFLDELNKNLLKVANVKPIVNVPSQAVEVDFKPIELAFKELSKTIKSSSAKTSEVDNKPIEKVLKTALGVLKEIRDKPTATRGGGGGGRATPYENSAGEPYFVQVDSANRIPVTSTPSTSTSPTVTAVSDTASSTTLLASNTSRKGATIVNDSSARLYVKLGTTASTTSYTISLGQHDYLEVPFSYTGRIDGIWASDPNDGGARVTELT